MSNIKNNSRKSLYAVVGNCLLFLIAGVVRLKKLGRWWFESIADYMVCFQCHRKVSVKRNNN